MGQNIQRVSFSRLQVFEKCKYQAKLAYIDKIPEPPRPLPKGKSEHANDRGSRIHDAAERYVRGEADLIPELRRFKEEFEDLRELYEEGRVELEGEWALTLEWEWTTWEAKDAWLRMKLDALVLSTNKKFARVIDYKTGQRRNNEIKHTEQGQVYQIGAFLRHPELNSLAVEFWYTDLGEIDVKTYTREEGLSYLSNYHKRFLKVTAAEEFPPNPNAFSCKWCPYNGNACEHGYQPMSASKAQSALQKLKQRKKVQ